MRIQNTLFIASLVGATLLVGAMALLMQWSLDRGLLEYANTREAERWQPAADALERYYELNRGWAGINSIRQGYLYRCLHGSGRDQYQDHGKVRRLGQMSYQ